MTLAIALARGPNPKSVLWRIVARTDRHRKDKQVFTAVHAYRICVPHALGGADHMGRRSASHRDGKSGRYSKQSARRSPSIDVTVRRGPGSLVL